MNQLLVTKTRNTGSQIGEFTLVLLGSLLFFPLPISGWMLVTIPDRYQAEVKFRSRALLTSGIVTERREKQICYASGGLGATSCTRSCDLKVKFTNNGKIVGFWDSCYKSVNENQVVSVLYDPTNVSKARIDREDTPESLARDQFVMSMFLGLMGIGHLTYFLKTETNQKQT